MTILVLDLKAPDVAGRREYDAAVLAALPQFYGFALSFGLLCLLWMVNCSRFSKNLSSFNFVSLNSS